MGIVTKRNGKILMILGVLLVINSFLTHNFLVNVFGESYSLVLETSLGLMLYIVGPTFAVVGIPVFIVGAKRDPSKLMDILKSSPTIRTRTKISFLAQQLAIKEKDVTSTVSRLRSNGEPISIDYSTSEVIYNPTLLSPSTKIKKPSMTSYEKLTVIFTILSVLVTIVIALLK